MNQNLLNVFAFTHVKINVSFFVYAIGFPFDTYGLKIGPFTRLLQFAGTALSSAPVSTSK